MMNARFSDYVTSGAFSLTLTRNQISELGLIGAGSVRYSSVSGALERKGLVEPVMARTEDEPLHEPDEQFLDHRLTGAGALTLALLAHAGLSNAGSDVLAREVDDPRRQLAAANERAHDAALRARDARTVEEGGRNLRAPRSETQRRQDPHSRHAARPAAERHHRRPS